MDPVQVLQRLSSFGEAVRESKVEGIEAEVTWWALTSNPKTGMQKCEKAGGHHILLLHEQLGISEADLRKAFNMTSTSRTKLYVEKLNAALQCQLFYPGTWNHILFLTVLKSDHQEGATVTASPVAGGLIANREWAQAKELLDLIKQGEPDIEVHTMVPRSLHSEIDSPPQIIDSTPTNFASTRSEQSETISERQHATPPVQKGARHQTIQSNKIASFKAFLSMEATTKYHTCSSHVSRLLWFSTSKFKHRKCKLFKRKLHTTNKVYSQVIGLGGEKAIDLITLDGICAGETELDDTPPHRFHLQQYELPPASKVTGELVQVRTNFHNKYLTRTDFCRYQRERENCSGD